MAKIFISYRRDDSEYQTDRLYRELKQFVENPSEDIFIDVDNIPYGVDFVDHLESKVAQCKVLLAVIGKDWLNHLNSDTGEQSLLNPKDFVRVEIATALRREIPVVPVLLDGTPVPSAEHLPDDLKLLARRNGKIVNRASFAADVKSLVDRLPVEFAPPANIRQARDAADTEDAGAVKMWGSIDSSLDPHDYTEFKEHFANSKWAFEAGRRIRQLQAWSLVDQADAQAIAEFRTRSRETAQLFEALEAHTQKVMRKAAAAAHKNLEQSSASDANTNSSDQDAGPTDSSALNRGGKSAFLLGAAVIALFTLYLIWWLFENDAFALR